MADGHHQMQPAVDLVVAQAALVEAEEIQVETVQEITIQEEAPVKIKETIMEVKQKGGIKVKELTITKRRHHARGR